ncbi:MAG: hypothetical protein JXR75_01915 [Rhodobacteraceae bacterium]|nr:hypothetical protein [Paracoccaceae bacterium]
MLRHRLGPVPVVIALTWMPATLAATVVLALPLAAAAMVMARFGNRIGTGAVPAPRRRAEVIEGDWVRLDPQRIDGGRND